MTGRLGENIATVSKSSESITPLRGDTQLKLREAYQTLAHIYTPSRSLMSLCISPTVWPLSGKHPTHNNAASNSTHTSRIIRRHLGTSFSQPCVFCAAAKIACLCLSFSQIFDLFGKCWDFHFTSLSIFLFVLQSGASALVCTCRVFTCGCYGQPTTDGALTPVQCHVLYIALCLRVGKSSLI